MSDRGKPLAQVGFSLVIVALVLAVYAPAIRSTYGFHNDYEYFCPNKNAPWWRCLLESNHLLVIGRPIGAILYNVQGRLIRRIDDLRLSRIVQLGLTLLCMWIFAHYLAKRGILPRFWSILASFSVFLLPSNQLSVLSVTQLAPGPITLLLALLTYEIIDRVRLDLAGPHRPVFSIVLFLLVTIPLVEIPMCIYPPTTLFMLVLTAAHVLFDSLERWNRTRRIVIRDLAVLSSSMAVYFLGVRFCYMPILRLAMPEANDAFESILRHGGAYVFGLTSHLLDSMTTLGRVARISLGHILHPLWGDLATILVVLVCALLWIALALFTKISGPKRPVSSQRTLTEAVSSMLFIFLLVVAPYVLASGDPKLFNLGYRMLFAPTAMVTLLILAPIVRIERALLPSASFRFRAVVVVLFVGIHVVCAGKSLGLSVHHLVTEFDFFRSKLDRLDPHVTDITAILRNRHAPIVGGSHSLELGWIMTSPDHVIGLVNGLLPDRSPSPRIQVFMGKDPGRWIRLDRRSVLVNLFEAGDEALRGDPKTRQSIRVLCSSNSPGPGERSLHVVDGNPHTYWQGAAPPQTIDLEFFPPVAIVWYCFVSLPIPGIPDGVPTSWSVHGSQSGTPFRLISTGALPRTDGRAPSSPFAVKKPTLFDRYRFKIERSSGPCVRVNELRLGLGMKAP